MNTAVQEAPTVEPEQRVKPRTRVAGSCSGAGGTASATGASASVASANTAVLARVAAAPADDPLQRLLAAAVARRATGPLLARQPVTAVAPAAGPAAVAAPPAPAVDSPEPRVPGGTARTRAFFTANAAMLRKLPATDEELLFLLDEVLAKGADLVIEYHAYNYNKSWRGTPITHRLFMRRNPGVDPMTSLADESSKTTFGVMIDSWDKVAAKLGGWEKVGVTPAHWAEIKKIRDAVVYPLMRIVFPRVFVPGALAKDATVGQRIAHRAYTYLGVRYVWGGGLKSEKPEAADPGSEQGGVDCADLVRRVLKDVKVTWTNAPGGGDKNDHVVGASADWITIVKPKMADLQPGDLVISDSHIGIYIGDGLMIHAPHTGRVVSKEKLDIDHFKHFRRYQPKAADAAPAAAAPTAAP